MIYKNKITSAGMLALPNVVGLFLCLATDLTRVDMSYSSATHVLIVSHLPSKAFS